MTRHPSNTRTPVRLALFAVALASTACGSGPSLQEWRAAHFDLRPSSSRGNLESELALVDALRNRSELVAARNLALQLVGENPEDATALAMASRAESDFVLFQPKPPEEQRELALKSALDWARSAAARDPRPEALGQLAWTLGATTHLESMFARAGHATETLETADRALALDPVQELALHTKAVLNLRLSTLPWIARAFAFGAPSGNLDDALDLARQTVRISASIENQILLARVLRALDREEEARKVLLEAQAGVDEFPRDKVMRTVVSEALEEE